MSEEKNPPRAQIFRYFRIESRKKNVLVMISTISKMIFSTFTLKYMNNLITDTAHTNSMSAETSRREILDDDVLACPGADLGFSRGGGGFSKKTRKF